MPLTPRSLAERVLYVLVGAALFVLAFFFLTVALIAGAIVALAVIGRMWWMSRKLRRAQGQTEIEGEFTLVEQREAIQRIDTRPPRPDS